MAQTVSRIVLDNEDYRAYLRDRMALIERFGFPCEVQPHHRAEYEAERKRMESALRQCFRTE